MKPLGTSYDTRAKMRRFARRERSMRVLARMTANVLVQFDQVAPGWRRVRQTFVEFTCAEIHPGRPCSGQHGNVDVIDELPGGITIRGWDLTGALGRLR